MDRKVINPQPRRNSRKLIWVCAGVMFLVAVVGFVIWTQYQTHPIRPQEPSKPYPYYSEEVSFENPSAGITLVGTLTRPSKTGIYPAVVLISGSGPQTRDGEFAGHKWFLVLADYLTRNGIAVLRYDDRGFGKSTGNFAVGTSLDFSHDAESAVHFLSSRKDIRHEKIGLIGHSDGGMIAPMVASRTNEVSFVVLLAGPGMKGSKLLLDRQEALERKLGKSESEIQLSRLHSEKITKIIVNSKDTETAKGALKSFSRENYDQIPKDAIPPTMSKDEFIARQIEMLSSPWFKYFLTYDPLPILQKVKCPVLAMNGDKDVQVPSHANLQGIREALNAGGNRNVTIRELTGLNHAFQECSTGMLDEYSTISQTFSPTALSAIEEWIAQQ